MEADGLSTGLMPGSSAGPNGATGGDAGVLSGVVSIGGGAGAAANDMEAVIYPRKKCINKSTFSITEPQFAGKHEI